MNRATNRMRDKLLRRAKSQIAAHDVPPGEHSMQIHHGHNLTHAYIRMDPPPANGTAQFTLPQYRAMIAEMTRCAESLEAVQQPTTGQTS
jgi:hypothetical protein